MRAQCVLAVLLFSGFVAQSSALWRDTWDTVKDKAKKVGTWVKENCSVGIPLGISCRLNGKKRGLDLQSKASLDKTCDEVGQNPLATDGGFSVELVQSIFEDIDGDKDPAGADGVLNEVEYAEFVESMEVFKYCLTKQQ